MTWGAGAVFGLVWLIVVVPPFVVFSVFFYLRMDKQPIRGRSPELVLVCNAALIAWTVALCVQRFAGASYPCTVNTVFAFIGVICIGFVYLARCWTLYFSYHITKERLAVTDDAELLARETVTVVDADGNEVQSGAKRSFFFRNRHLISPRFFAEVFSVSFVLLMVPCIVLLATDREINHLYGDNCSRKWGDVVLLVYALSYIVLFVRFGWALRSVVDGFRIKEELRWSCVVGICTAIPWFVFNDLERDINIHTFPVSTLVLVVGVALVLTASTAWPLYASIKPPKIELESVSADLSTLAGVLEDRVGLETFKEFLTHEFSVENLLFWQEVEHFRQLLREDAPYDALRDFAQKVYTKYLIDGAPFEVNISGTCRADTKRRLRDTYGGGARGSAASVSAHPNPHAHPSSPSMSHPESQPGGSLPAPGATNHDLRIPVSASVQSLDGVELEPLTQHEVAPPHIANGDEERGGGRGGARGAPQPPTIFDAAQAEIYRLMATDSFNRFKASQTYAELCRNHVIRQRKNEVIKEVAGVSA